MSNYRYRIYHDDNHCAQSDLIRPKLTDDLLDHEYDNLDTALHLFCRAQNVAITYKTARSSLGGVEVTLQGFRSQHEADTFINQFPTWLTAKISHRFCPAIQKLEH